MLQEKINKLIQYKWTNAGIKNADSEIQNLWKEFAEDLNIDSKAQQAIINYLNKTKSYKTLDDYKNFLITNNISLIDDFEFVILEEFSLIVNKIGNNFFASSSLNNNFLKIEAFFNFIWYCLFPILYCKVFINFIKTKNDFISGLFNEISLIVYHKEVDLNNITLERKHLSTRILLIIAGNLLDSLNNKVE